MRRQVWTVPRARVEILGNRTVLYMYCQMYVSEESRSSLDMSKTLLF